MSALKAAIRYVDRVAMSGPYIGRPTLVVPQVEDCWVDNGVGPTYKFVSSFVLDNYVNRAAIAIAIVSPSQRDERKGGKPH